MKTIKLTAPGKLTKNCFTDFYYRDSDFDEFLPKHQPAGKADITVIIRNKKQTFLEMAQEYLGTQDPKEIQKHCLTLPMVEEMIAEYSDQMRTDGYGNFFFVENADGSVSVARVRRDDSRWGALVRRLGLVDRWFAGSRLLVRNLDTRANLDSLDPVLDLDTQPSTPSATEWEKELELMLGIAPEGTLKYEREMQLKSFIRKLLTAARIEGERKGRSAAVDYIKAECLRQIDGSIVYHPQTIERAVEMVENVGVILKRILEAARQGEVE